MAMTSDQPSAAGMIMADPETHDPGRRTVLGVLMRIELLLGRTESLVASAALAVAVLAIGTSVVVRAFALPLPDTGEWAIVAMSPLTFVGAALCSHLHRHLTADIVEALPPGRLLRLLEGIAAALFVVFGLYFVALAADLFGYALNSRERLIDLGTPIAIPVGFMLAGAVLMTFHAVLDVIRACTGREPGGIDPWH